MKHFRIRRGKRVEIPPQWVGQIPHAQTVRKRPSKGLRKHRRSDRTKNSGYATANYWTWKQTGLTRRERRWAA